MPVDILPQHCTNNLDKEQTPIRILFTRVIMPQEFNDLAASLFLSAQDSAHI